MDWLTEHYIEIFGAITGIIYVFLEIKRNIWLWPLGIVTSAIYIIVFYHSKFYADMGLQWYYLLISVYGWIIWAKDKKQGEWNRDQGEVNDKRRKTKGGGRENNDDRSLQVSNIKPKLALWLALVTLVLFAVICFVLIRFTDSPVPVWDAFTTALSITATWMLARKIIEHWYLWVIVNIVSIGLYIYKGLFPTVILFIVYAVMAIIGYREWARALKQNSDLSAE